MDGDKFLKDIFAEVTALEDCTRRMGFLKVGKDLGGGAIAAAFKVFFSSS